MSVQYQCVRCGNIADVGNCGGLCMTCGGLMSVVKFIPAADEALADALAREYFRPEAIDDRLKLTLLMIYRRGFIAGLDKAVEIKNRK